MPESTTHLRLVDRIRQRVAAELNDRKDRTSSALDELADKVRRVGEPLREEPPLETLGGYVDRAAARLERLASDLRERDVSELAEELRGLARRRPALFAAAGFAAGLIAARLLKSSEPARRSGRSAGGRTRAADSGAPKRRTARAARTRRGAAKATRDRTGQ